MKKIVNERYQETRFEETLENGLHVIHVYDGNPFRCHGYETG